MGNFASFIIKADGSLWACGNNEYGQLGLGNNENRNTHVQVGTAVDWKVVSAGAGGSHTVALKADGSLWACGNNEYGQLGLGNTKNRNAPAQVGTAKDWAAVSAGLSHTVAIKTDGSLWAWGANTFGQLGLGDNEEYNTPAQVGTAKDWVQLWH